MSEWHDEFRAYARAFGKDEVAAILLRNDEEDEWLLWPDQKVEGLTFTLTADSILSIVPAENLQHVVGWVHSHPSGIQPSPSSTDDEQIREIARDLAGGVAEMWIFGGHSYELYSTTRAVLLNDRVFVSDAETWRLPSPATEWDEVATQLYKDSQRVPSLPSYGYLSGFHYDSDRRWAGTKHECQLCQASLADKPGELCPECDDQMSMNAWLDETSVKELY